MELSIIQQMIYEIRGQKVMLDFDLAKLYEVPTKALNQALKRNIERFPADFMFRLTSEEWTDLYQNGIRSHFVTASASQRNRNIGITPYAFTEHGVTMLASILKSPKAVQMNIAIVRAFIGLRRLAMQYKELADEIQEIRETVENHSEQLGKIYEAIETLLAEKDGQKVWTQRERIGFK
jgi:phage regulator Rha-like protein